MFYRPEMNLQFFLSRRGNQENALTEEIGAGFIAIRMHLHREEDGVREEFPINLYTISPGFVRWAGKSLPSPDTEKVEEMMIMLISTLSDERVGPTVSDEEGIIQDGECRLAQQLAHWWHYSIGTIGRIGIWEESGVEWLIICYLPTTGQCHQWEWEGKEGEEGDHREWNAWMFY